MNGRSLCRDNVISSTLDFVLMSSNRGIFLIILTMALLNFFARLTYENILSPMILARSGNQSVVPGVVNAVMGIGGIIGGIIVSTGRNVIVWSFAGVLAKIVGTGAGSGMAVMFLCTGVLGALFSLLSYRQKAIRALDEDKSST